MNGAFVPDFQQPMTCSSNSSQIKFNVSFNQVDPHFVGCTAGSEIQEKEPPGRG